MFSHHYLPTAKRSKCRVPIVQFSNFAKGMAALYMLPAFDYTFTKYKSCTKQLEHDKTDVTALTLYDFIILARNFPGKLNATAFIDYSSGGDAIVVRPDINGID